mmetsp:Transcript_2206/g.2453  ORF Transcript_2206/g.2453 Transcript_2206/m.2453 type:complete len:85 (+) Transcript_2206:114-368(+)
MEMLDMIGGYIFQVEKMLSDHDLMDVFTGMINEDVDAGVGSCFNGGWDLEKLISHKEEYISHSQYGGCTEYYRWTDVVIVITNK